MTGAPAKRGFGSRIKAFGETRVGFLVLVAIIVALSGLLIGSLGIPVGAVLMLAVAFGIPVYLGWKRSIKLMFLVALACLVFAPFFAGIVVTESAIAPSATVASTDGVLENVTVSPFEANSGAGVFAFHVQAWPSKIPEKYGAWLEQVYIWVSNCQYATDQSTAGKNPCYLSPALVFKNFTDDLTPAQQNATGGVALTLNATGLPSGQIYYFIVLTAVANRTTGVWYYALNSNVGGWSCTVEPSYGGCSYTAGPISTGWGGVFELLLPGTYLSVGLTVAVLVAFILVYNYLKGREKLRQAAAKAAAQGDGTLPAQAEVRCPSCNAVVDPGETTCWKCGKPVSGSASASASKGSGKGKGPSTAAAPLASSSGPAGSPADATDPEPEEGSG